MKHIKTLCGILILALTIIKQNSIAAVDAVAGLTTAFGPMIAPYTLRGKPVENITTGVLSGYEKFGRRTRPGWFDAAVLGSKLAHQAYKVYSGGEADTTALAGLAGEALVAGHMLSQTRTRALQALKEDPLSEFKRMFYYFKQSQAREGLKPYEQQEYNKEIENLPSKVPLTYIRDIVGEDNKEIWEDIKKTTQAEYNMWRNALLSLNINLPELNFADESLTLLNLPATAFTLLVDTALEKVAPLEGIQKYIRSSLNTLTAPTRFSWNVMQKLFSSSNSEQGTESSPQIAATEAQKKQQLASLQALLLQSIANKQSTASQTATLSQHSSPQQVEAPAAFRRLSPPPQQQNRTPSPQRRGIRKDMYNRFK